ncbi:MAG: hypothetical protein KBD44_01845 [Candidatus Pacebacteria bacterium]|nr:hypothetical protein [Candidatus Paceibacterota bacterium]
MELPKESKMRSDGASEELSATQGEIDLLPLKQFFDVTDSSQDKHLETILGWAQSKGINNRADMQLELRRLEMKLGATELGENRLARLSRYLVLDGKLNHTLKEMQSYEK